MLSHVTGGALKHLQSRQRRNTHRFLPSKRHSGARLAGWHNRRMLVTTLYPDTPPWIKSCGIKPKHINTSGKNKWLKHELYVSINAKFNFKGWESRFMLQSVRKLFFLGGIFVGRGLLSSQKLERDFLCLIKTPETPDRVMLFVLQWYTDVAAAALKANSRAACIGVKVF